MSFWPGSIRTFWTWHLCGLPSPGSLPTRSGRLMRNLYALSAYKPDCQTAGMQSQIHLAEIRGPGWETAAPTRMTSLWKRSVRFP